MKKTISVTLIACALLLGACSSPEPVGETVSPSIPAPASDQPQEVTADPTAAEAMTPQQVAGIRMTNLAPFSAGAYQVQPKYEDALSDGHINLTVTGGEIGAVRMWVGGEDPTGSLVVKAVIENDYYHGHLEMPDPIPGDVRLWAEIENPAGETFKGSTPLQ